MRLSAAGCSPRHGTGATLGAVAGHAAAGLSRGDPKELGEALDAGEAGLIGVAVADMGSRVAEAMKRAEKVAEKEITVDSWQAGEGRQRGASAGGDDSWVRDGWFCARSVGPGLGLCCPERYVVLTQDIRRQRRRRRGHAWAAQIVKQALGMLDLARRSGDRARPRRLAVRGTGRATAFTRRRKVTSDGRPEEATTPPPRSALDGVVTAAHGDFTRPWREDSRDDKTKFNEEWVRIVRAPFVAGLAHRLPTPEGGVGGGEGDHGGAEVRHQSTES